jgi:hypothetical protein
MEGVLLEVLHEQMSDKATAGVGAMEENLTRPAPLRFLNSLERQRRCDGRADGRLVKIVEYILQHEVCLHKPYV